MSIYICCNFRGVTPSPPPTSSKYRLKPSLKLYHNRHLFSDLGLTLHLLRDNGPGKSFFFLVKFLLERSEAERSLIHLCRSRSSSSHSITSSTLFRRSHLPTIILWEGGVEGSASQKLKITKSLTEICW